MPKLNQFRLYHEEGGQEICELLDQLVSGNGREFSVVVPPYLLSVVENIVKVSDDCDKVQEVHKRMRLVGPELTRLHQKLNQAAVEHLKCTELRELVILYRTRGRSSFWQNPDGTLAPNGYTGNREGSWSEIGGLNSTERAPFYDVGLWVSPAWKVTYRRTSGDTVTYETVGGSIHGSEPLYAQYPTLNALASFTGLADPDRFEKVSQMPYTEEAAKFFLNAMLTICALTKSFHQIFSDPKTLEKNIQSGTGILSLNPAQ